MPKYREYKCGKCGWIHAAITRAEADQFVESANSYCLAQGSPKTATLAQYMRCSRCGAPSADFLPARAGDVPAGATLPVVYVPHAYGGHT